MPRSAKAPFLPVPSSGGPAVEKVGRSGITVERVSLEHRLQRLLFVQAGDALHRSVRGPRSPGFIAETYHLDPRNSPGLACMEVLGLIARRDGRVVGRMVVLRPSGGGEEGWFTRFDQVGGPDVLAGLAQEGARWIGRGGGSRWLGPVGLMPGEVCGVQVDGFVGRRVGDLPQARPGTGQALSAVGFTVAAESGFWCVPVHPVPHHTRAEAHSVDLSCLEDASGVDWPRLLARLPRSTDPVSRLHCDPTRLRHELLRSAVPGGVRYVVEAGEVVALGVLRPHCAAVPGMRVPRFVARLRYWKRRLGTAEGIAQVFSIAERAADALVAGAVLDQLLEQARSRGYRRLLVGPISTDAQGAISALRDRGARIDRRYHVFAQTIDRPGQPTRPLQAPPR